MHGFWDGQPVCHREHDRHGNPSPNAGQRGNVVGASLHMVKVFWEHGLVGWVCPEELEARGPDPVVTASDPVPPPQDWPQPF